MREVFRNQDSARVGFYKSVLDEAGIPNFTRNEFGNNSADGLQGPTVFPALCVLQESDYEEAMRILGAIYYGAPTSLPDWQCAKCGEEVPGNFDSCWKCGGFRPERATEADPEG